jgi:alkylhydroperoxidase/carboxymuconolactone decarboxylase family protein YurZ
MIIAFHEMLKCGGGVFMAFKMTAQLNRVFETCKQDTLDPKTSELIALAVHLVSNHAEGATESVRQAQKHGATAEQMHRVACLSACTAGARVHDLHLRATKDLGGASGTGSSALRLEKSAFHACSSKSLDKKTMHLVALAACLASHCECARGHIVEARNAGATAAELARCACITSCIGGLQHKYAFLEHLASVENCKACAC